MNLINDNSCFSPLFIKKLANQGTVYILRDTRRSSHIPYIKNSSQKKKLCVDQPDSIMYTIRVNQLMRCTHTQLQMPGLQGQYDPQAFHDDVRCKSLG